MSSRHSLRRKVVVAVTVIRSSQESQLAHTLDITENSARLGGLFTPLDPGETVEIQRGAFRAKFQVIWMGAPGTAMAGKAGVRSLEPGKVIWDASLPQDQVDLKIPAQDERSAKPAVRTLSLLPGDRRWYSRYQCKGSASVKTKASSFAMHGEIKDISQGGVYIETSAPLAVNSEVSMSLTVEGVTFEATGIVSTSYPMVGMGVSFQEPAAEERQKLITVLHKLERGSTGEESKPAAQPAAGRNGSTADVTTSATSAVHALITACHGLSASFEASRNNFSLDEVEQLQQALEQLQQKLNASSGANTRKQWSN